MRRVILLGVVWGLGFSMPTADSSSHEGHHEGHH